MEKPAATSIREVGKLIAVSQNKNLTVMTGLKKIFFPAVEKAKDIITSAEFGKPSSIYIRYPQSIPELNERQNVNKMTGFLDHIFHPVSVLNYLMGPIQHVFYIREPNNGGSITNITFLSGAIGTMHLTAGMSNNSPLERVEVIGEGANVVIDNGVKMTYYRPAAPFPYGREESYLAENRQAALYWEPEFSLGQLYNKNIFYLGYVSEVLHFCESILENKPIQKGTLNDVLEILKLFECYQQNKPNEVNIINKN